MHLLIDNEIPKIKLKKFTCNLHKHWIYKFKVDISHLQSLFLNFSLVNMKERMTDCHVIQTIWQDGT